MHMQLSWGFNNNGMGDAVATVPCMNTRLGILGGRVGPWYQWRNVGVWGRRVGAMGAWKQYQTLSWASCWGG